MTLKEKIIDNKLPFFTVMIYFSVLLIEPKIFVDGLETTWIYIRQMIEILPAIFILTGLIEVWVSKETILKTFGAKAGIKGKLISVFIGSVSAGPIYAAFPVTQTLYKKGASLANIVIILSAWAVIKAPMLIVETKFLGFDFMISRYILTVPGILAIGYVTSRLVEREDIMSVVKGSSDVLKDKIIEILPGYNCGSCGYKSCYACAEALAGGDEMPGACKPGGEEVEEKIKELKGKK